MVLLGFQNEIYIYSQTITFSGVKPDIWLKSLTVKQIKILKNQYCTKNNVQKLYNLLKRQAFQQ